MKRISSAGPWTTRRQRSSLPDSSRGASSGELGVYILGLTLLTLSWCQRDVAAGIACLSNPCVNGVCLDGINTTYSCYCIDGFTGVHCQTNWDECWSSPCTNGGTCIDGIAEYNCTCPDGYTGTNCEINFDECESNPCQNNGTCIDGANGYMCSCPPGYSGTFCEVDIAVCNSSEEARCYNGGQCIEGPGMSFKCKCRPGWEGKLCEAEINECASHPCKNGGLCIDSFAEYYCACSMGFTGKDCDSKIEMCTDNPCTNKAICMMESQLWRCYCVPDYHGEKCQYQYDECLLGPRCMNGGTCIDGVDNFTCSCPPKLIGPHCECLILDSGKLDCQYVSPSPPTTEFVPTKSSPTMTSNYLTSTTPAVLTTDVEVSNATLYTTNEYSTSKNVPTTPWDQTTYTTIENLPITSTERPQITTSSQAISTETLVTDLVSSESTYGNTTKSIDDNINTTKTTYDYTKEWTTIGTQTPSSTIDTIRSTIDYFITTFIPKTDQSTDIKTNLFTSQTPPYADKSTVATTDVTEPSISSTEINTLKAITEKLPSSTEPSETVSSTESKTSTIPPLKNATETTSTTEARGVQTTEYIQKTEDNLPHFTTPYSTTWNITDFPLSSTESNDASKSTSTETIDCFLSCFNGGTCVHSTRGEKCVCKFDYNGPNCDDRVEITNAAFSGDSYLSHKLERRSGMSVQLKARTLSPNGLILFANLGPDIYMSLYMVRGLLKFKFSCGYQTMLLSELEMPINNGFEFKIKTVLDFINGRMYCNASLHINDTLAMSGGQMVARPITTLSRDSWLHLGAVPESYDKASHSPPSVEPFTGCMFDLQIDGMARYIFNDAREGFEIKECSSLACLSNPCQNEGTCNEVGERWMCLCANGYLGRHCESSVCDTNPCQYGGTCVEHPGSGFLCLCPLGKHGLYCEHNLEVTQLSFSAMVGGLSSYAVYQLPQNLVTNGIEIHFRIQPSNLDQISLLAFLGQAGPHDPRSDHLAVTFVKGYIMLTWNLGNGPRRIFTSRPLMPRNNKPYLIKFGRTGRIAWLAVDNTQNITGNAPGSLQTLDVLPYLYIGGHESANFSILPHDLPLHGGFSGCIWDLWAGSIGSKSSNGVTFTPIRGRAVGQCGVTQCHPMICHNSGACLHHAATYSCLCPQGWFGPLCTSQQNPCDYTVNQCSKVSVCVPTLRGYQCDCPLGKAGKFCEIAVKITDASFSGIRSYIKLEPSIIGDVLFSIEFEVKPIRPKGILLYSETRDGCFVSLSLQGGLLEFRWAGIEWSGKSFGNRKAVVVRSGVVLSIDSWYTVRAGRYGRKLFLWVDGTMTTETLTGHQFFTAVNTSIYIGGVEDLSALPVDVTTGHAMSFTGCIRKVIINNKRIPLDNDHILESRNIDDCDGDICGGDVCWNGGTCVIVKKYRNSTAVCVCEYPYMGPQCAQKIPCTPGECGRGRCIKDMCVCPNGWEGYHCQNQIKIGTPQFSGNSYMVIDDNKFQTSEKLVKSNKMRLRRSANYIYMNFTTAKPDGLLLWGETKNKKHISVGLDGGYLKMSWTIPKHVWRSHPKEKNVSRLTWSSDVAKEMDSVKLIQAGRIYNGEWHTLSFKMQPGNVTIVTDNKIVYEESSLNFDADYDDMVVHLGGFPYSVSTWDRTRGLYFSNFQGCIDELLFGADRQSIRNFSRFDSENLESCQLYP